MSCAHCESNWHHVRQCPLVRDDCYCNNESEPCEYHEGYLDACAAIEDRTERRQRQRHPSTRGRAN